MLYASLAASARLAASGAARGPAVVDPEVRWSWRELDERADEVARSLGRAGVGLGDRVGLLAPPSATAIAALHGIARAGAVAAPLGLGLSAAELVAAAQAMDPRLVICGSGFESAAAAAGRPTLALDGLFVTVGEPRSERRQAAVAAPLARDSAAAGARFAAVAGPPAVAGPRLAPVGPEADPAAPAVVVLTSGTTGRPRAAILSTAALVASVEAWLAVLPPATGWLLVLGLGHIAGLGVAWRAALSGVPLVVLPQSDAAGILAALAGDPAPSHVSLVPAMLVRLLDAAGDGPPPATLRAALVGGGPISPELVTRALDAGWPIVPTYGLTEAGSGVTALPTSEAAGHPGSAGRPLPGVNVRIAEPDEAHAGEIVIRSPAQFTGYLDDPMGTAAARADDGWLRTGDFGRLDPDGRLTVLDRRVDRIVRGGENISPAEVEAALLAHPAIAAAGVVARRDDTLGHVPVAAIVLRAGVADPGDADLARHCRSRLAGFKVPAAFIRLESLPMTPGGKLRRAELRALLDPLADAPFRPRSVARPGGVRIAYLTFGSGPVHLLLLHGTLSTAAQLAGLAHLLAASGALTVHAVDRRGSGSSRLAEPEPIGIETHVDDLAAVLDAEGCRAAALVGVSFGGVVALEFAARMPDLALAVVAWEPPYGPLADAATRRAFAAVARATERAYEAGGPGSAARTFVRGVAGDGAWDRLGDRSRTFLASEGDSAYMDAGLRGLDPSGLRRIHVPTTILTGDASEPFYGPIADALVDHIEGSRRVRLPGMRHTSPITDPDLMADAVGIALAAGGESQA